MPSNYAKHCERRTRGQKIGKNVGNQKNIHFQFYWTFSGWSTWKYIFWIFHIVPNFLALLGFLDLHSQWFETYSSISSQCDGQIRIFWYFGYLRMAFSVYNIFIFEYLHDMLWSYKNMTHDLIMPMLEKVKLQKVTKRKKKVYIVYLGIGISIWIIIKIEDSH